MARATALRRHRVGIASGVALAVATAAVVTYALSAEGYKKHEAELNDGGVWVVNGKLGWSGRLNKPINQLDGVVPGQDGKARLDVVQDGAAVVTLNRNAARGQAIETSQLEAQDGGSAAVPVNGDVRMAGGTLATADAQTGEVWAVRYDSQVGKPLMSAVDRQADPLAEAGEGAALAVGLDGTVVVTSTEERTVTTLAPRSTAFRKPASPTCPETPAGLGGHHGRRARRHARRRRRGPRRGRRRDGAPSRPRACCSSPGPAYDAVLVGAPDGLLEHRPRVR